MLNRLKVEKTITVEMQYDILTWHELGMEVSSLTSIYFCGQLIILCYEMGFQEGNTDLEHCTFRKKEFEVQWFAV
jgi:hypothetical protein